MMAKVSAAFEGGEDTFDGAKDSLVVRVRPPETQQLVETNEIFRPGEPACGQFGDESHLLTGGVSTKRPRELVQALQGGGCRHFQA